MRGTASKRFDELRNNQSGAVAVMFAVTLIPLTAMVGLAVDFGRVYNVSSDTQVALDAAALAAGRTAQVETVDVVNKASSAANSYFNQAKPKDVVISTLQFSPNSDNTQFRVTAASWVRTPFLGTLKYLISKPSDPAAPTGCTGNFFACVRLNTTATAQLKAGGDGGTNVEVAMMLDVTGSMCSPCSKIDALKPAAKDLIDIVVWDDQSQHTSKVALAPFAEAVNVGTALAPLVRGTVTVNTSSDPQVLNMGNSSYPTSKWIKYARAGGGGNLTNTWQISTKCVTERTGAQAFTDAAPSAAPVGKGYFGTDAAASCVVGNYSDAEVNSVQPLSSDKTMLKRRIDKFATSGSTAGHLGTAWAWYLLSPNWAYLFPGPNKAAPYSDLTATNSNGTPKLRKIAVLMTDGDYNINYCKGVEAKNSDQSPDINCNSENGKSLAQATSLCAAMKNPLGNNSAAKIEVFTVGFQVSSTARNFLKNCATDANHYYDATTGDALKAAFRDIALKISTLRLTQ